eukprot:TRINITY_DN18016_c3_g1_i1.p1 TRINITY_DN18016_c3_g1~~TRINITY_DN18016_c3_g1_i1.p1  ORF type:complete len:141 (+),score=4.23 TRINITY_DN18016_c3_g1_i1:826-1248(+)
MDKTVLLLPGLPLSTFDPEEPRFMYTPMSTPRSPGTIETIVAQRKSREASQRMLFTVQDGVSPRFEGSTIPMTVFGNRGGRAGQRRLKITPLSPCGPPGTPMPWGEECVSECSRGASATPIASVRLRPRQVPVSLGVRWA